MAENRKFNLITRSDFDGLVCALLFMHKEILNNVNFAHPKDMQDGKVEVSDNDISTNLPYVEGIHMAFDHHLSETVRNEKRDNHIIDPEAPSARVSIPPLVVLSSCSHLSGAGTRFNPL